MSKVNVGGNAASQVDVEFDNGCYTATNNSGRNVKFGFGPVTFIVAPGGSHVPKDLAGNCLDNFLGTIWADFA